jgi:hypothetical protein
MKLLHGNIDDIELLVIQNLNLISIIYPFAEYLLSSFDYLLEHLTATQSAFNSC